MVSSKKETLNLMQVKNVIISYVPLMLRSGLGQEITQCDRISRSMCRKPQYQLDHFCDVLLSTESVAKVQHIYQTK